MLKTITFALLILVANLAAAQKITEQYINLKEGDYLLRDLLLQLRTNGVPLSFSPNRIPKHTITIEPNIQLGEILSELKKTKIIDYKEGKSQLIILPYQRKKFTISGIIEDLETRERLIGATIFIENINTGVLANAYGFFSITLEEGVYHLKASHSGFNSFEDSITLNNNTFLNLMLQPEVIQLEDITVNSVPNDFNIRENIPSISRLSISKSKDFVPYLGGEVDILQNALLQPGIKSIGEDGSGINIRGGAVDQNLYLMDEAVIYNPNHFFGLISVFNPEAINDAKILKGFVSPSYGGRVSGVVEVRQREGNSKKINVSGGIGFPSARMVVEGPLKKEKSSFLIAARQSLFIPSASNFGNTSVTRERFLFQDLNLKLNSRLNKNNTVYLSAYFGNDRNTAGLSSVRNWGNRMINFRWNRLLSPKLFSNLTTYISEYSYRTENQEAPGAFIGESRVADYSIKGDFIYSFTPKSELNFGTSVTFHRLNPGVRIPFDEQSSTNTLELDKEHAFESGLFIAHNWDIGKLSLNYGIRYSLFHNIGAKEVFIYEPGKSRTDSTIIDTVFFDQNELIKRYLNPEPRIAVNYKMNDNTAIKGSYGRSIQYLHLISNTLAPAPTDIWKTSDTYIKPTIADHFSLGLYKDVLQRQWSINIELYYKSIKNGIQFRSGADLVFNENIETEIFGTSGRSFGFELFSSKNTGKLKGWVSYTLSRAESFNSEASIKNYVLENHDRLHDFTTSWNIQLAERWFLSTNYVFRTGIPITLPSDKYIFEGNLIPHFTERNNRRLPPYHRLDLALKWEGKKTKKDGSIKKNNDQWILTIYNLYSRKNAFSYFFRESEINPGLGEIVQYSIFGTIIPAITYNFKF